MLKKHLMATLVAFTALMGTARAEDPVLIKFSHVVPAETPKGQAAEYFKKLVNERSHGRLLVEVYPNSYLYKDKEELEALQLNAVQMLAPSMSKFAPMGVRDFEVFDLPYLFDNAEEAQKVVNGPIGQSIAKKLETKGIVILGFWNSGFMQIHANRPMRVPDDVRGVKMRILSSKVMDAGARALGALPQTMAASEVYQALDTGLVDSGQNILSNIYYSKYYEVQKYITLTNHSYISFPVIVGKKFWDTLADDLKEIVTQAVKDSITFHNNAADKDNEFSLQQIVKSGKTNIISLTPEERALWKNTMIKTHEQLRGRFSEGLLDAIYKETGHGATGH